MSGSKSVNGSSISPAAAYLMGSLSAQKGGKAGKAGKPPKGSKKNNNAATNALNQLGLKNNPLASTLGLNPAASLLGGASPLSLSGASPSVVNGLIGVNGALAAGGLGGNTLGFG